VLVVAALERHLVDVALQVVLEVRVFVEREREALRHQLRARAMGDFTLIRTHGRLVLTVHHRRVAPHAIVVPLDVRKIGALAKGHPRVWSLGEVLGLQLFQRCAIKLLDRSDGAFASVRAAIQRGEGLGALALEQPACEVPGVAVAQIACIGFQQLAQVVVVARAPRAPSDRGPDISAQLAGGRMRELVLAGAGRGEHRPVRVHAAEHTRRALLGSAVEQIHGDVGAHVQLELLGDEGDVALELLGRSGADEPFRVDVEVLGLPAQWDVGTRRSCDVPIGASRCVVLVVGATARHQHMQREQADARALHGSHTPITLS
jgi:hypothetical protein